MSVNLVYRSMDSQAEAELDQVASIVARDLEVTVEDVRASLAEPGTLLPTRLDLATARTLANRWRQVGLTVEIVPLSAPLPGHGADYGQLASDSELSSTEELPVGRRCPFCAEEVRLEARKCKHCGEMLDALARRPGAALGTPGVTPGLAALMSGLIPGLGQLARRDPTAALLWFVSVAAGYMFFILPGFALYICCILNAYNGSCDLFQRGRPNG